MQVDVYICLNTLVNSDRAFDRDIDVAYTLSDPKTSKMRAYHASHVDWLTLKLRILIVARAQFDMEHDFNPSLGGNNWDTRFPHWSVACARAGWVRRGSVCAYGAASKIRAYGGEQAGG